MNLGLKKCVAHFFFRIRIVGKFLRNSKKSIHSNPNQTTENQSCLHAYRLCLGYNFLTRRIPDFETVICQN